MDSSHRLLRLPSQCRDVVGGTMQAGVAGAICSTGLMTLRRRSSGPRRQVTRMMPIGVPRVPYRTPREGGWQWVDIWNCLVRQPALPAARSQRVAAPGMLVGRTPDSP